MTDVFTPEQRSAVMACVKSIDTAPELAVRRIAHRLGYRYRLHRKDLPGKPDLAFAAARLALFVHGCFWHRHPECEAASMPASNVEYWSRKFAKNIARDAAAAEALKRLGWRVTVIWECETADHVQLAERLRRMLDSETEMLDHQSSDAAP